DVALPGAGVFAFHQALVVVLGDIALLLHVEGSDTAALRTVVLQASAGGGPDPPRAKWRSTGFLFIDWLVGDVVFKT
ncbi:MAG: hypothetical protein JW862_05125, partial [Anaerolineales bacterium]|nr:hypothetical protein [Anaerolineales bacterium]